MKSKRLWGLIHKEYLQNTRDLSSILIAFVMPLILLLINGFGMSFDIRNVPVGIVHNDSSTLPLSLYNSLRALPDFEPVIFLSDRAAEQSLIDRKIKAYINFETTHIVSPLSWIPKIQLIVNGVDAGQARIVSSYVTGALQTWLSGLLKERGYSFSGQIKVETQFWFNPELRSANFLVPGLIALVMTLIGTLLTALVVAREWERGTVESILSTPVSTTEILLARLIAFFVLGMASMLVCFLVAGFLFHVPFRGSFFALAIASGLFLLGALSVGLLISTITRNQFVAAQTAFIVSYLPAMMLSGFLFDINSMPTIIQWLTNIIAAKYFVACLQSLFLVGDVWAILIPNMLVLLLFAVIGLGLTLYFSRQKLE